MKCPGQDTRYWKPDDIFHVNCPDCDERIEFFKDDSSRTCAGCGCRIPNPRLSLGCAAHCKFAAQCLGELAYQKADKTAPLKERVREAMQAYFGPDSRRVKHACAVARYAEQLLRNIPGDEAVVIAAAYLHDIGIKEAENCESGSAVADHEQTGPGVARRILNDLGANDLLIDEVCDIIKHHHHPRHTTTENFKIVYDADVLANMLEDHNNSKALPFARGGLQNHSPFLTDFGIDLARRVLAEAGMNRLENDQ